MSFFQKSSKLLLKIGFFCFSFSCESEEPYVITCKDGQVQFEHFTNRYGGIKFIVDNEAIKHVAYVIQSELEWKSYVDPSSFGGRPDVDFTRKTVLLSRIYTEQDGVIEDYEVISNCSQNEYDFNITYQYSAVGSGGRSYYYYVIIPKIPEKANVNFNVAFVI